MRKTLAAVALAGAAFGMNTQPAAASGCYGVQYWATACYTGEASVSSWPWTFCVYTGGSTCENVTVPLVWPNTPYDAQVCVLLAGCTDVI